VIELRAIESRDVPAMLDLVADVLGEFGLEFGKGSPTDDELRHLPASYVDAGGMFWVALRDGELLGTCGVYPVEPHTQTFELRKMYLRGASRGLGVGKQLLDAAVAWTRAQGGKRLTLDTIEAMTRAIAFYEANGFTRDDAYKRAARCTRGYVREL
jgi:putative acetyltransferase